MRFFIGDAAVGYEGNALFYCRLIAGRYSSVFIIDTGSGLYYQVSHHRGVFSGGERWERFYQKVFRIWLDNPALRN